MVATVGRTDELLRFLESAAEQTYRGFQVIVVDQNEDDRLGPLLATFAPRVELRRFRAEHGLSHARNVGLAGSSGNLIAFPDDDCWYPPRLLEGVVAALTAHPEWAGLSVPTRDSRGRRSSMLWDMRSGPINRYNIWRRAISVGFFLRRPVVTAIGEFSEDLGLGSGTQWGSGEESDYLLRALGAGFSIQYEPSLFVYHESPRPAGGAVERRAAYVRGLGHGEVLRRHRYPHWFVALRVLQLVIGSAVLLVRGRLASARYYFAMALGRTNGWFGTSG